MAVPENQHAVREFPAQGAGEALADRVHPRSPDGCAHDPGAGGLDDGVGRGSEVRSAIADQEPDVPGPLAEGQSEVRACCTVQSPVGCAVTPPRCIRRLPCSMNTSTYMRVSSTVSTCRKSTARIPAACAVRNCRHVGPDRRGAGSMPAARRISHTVDGATVTPGFASSPWIRRVPPQRILPCPPNDQPGDARDPRRAAGLSLARAVLAAGQFAVPGQERARRHGEDPGPVPARQEPCHRGASTTPGRPARTAPGRACPPGCGVLVPEHEQFGVFRAVAAKHQDGQAEYPARQQVDDLDQHPASQPPLRPSCRQQCR